MTNAAFVYRIGGARLLADAPMALPTSGFHDVDVRVCAAGSIDADSTVAELVGEDGVEIRLSPDGLRAEIHDAEYRSNPEMRALWARRLVPFAAALQGRVTLHGAGVCFDDVTLAIVGESGVGKSTLACEFDRRGDTAFADDLLPVRIDPHGRIAVPAGMESALAPLTAICFPQRNARSRSLRVQQIDPPECMRLLLWHGFGELKNRDVWRTQFELYAAIANGVPAFRLEIPDDLARLEATVAQIRAHWMAGG